MRTTASEDPQEPVHLLIGRTKKGEKPVRYEMTPETSHSPTWMTIEEVASHILLHGPVYSTTKDASGKHVRAEKVEIIIRTPSDDDGDGNLGSLDEKEYTPSPGQSIQSFFEQKP